MDFQNDSLFIQVLKWLGVVLAAGFIGYFGRYLVMLAIERMRREKQKPTPATEAAPEAPASQETAPGFARLEIEHQQAKAEKKKAKAEAKRTKKTPPD